MTQTTIPFGDPRAMLRWANILSVDALSKSYFSKKFVGTDENSVIQQKTELESDAGDKVFFNLSVQLKGRPTPGDQRVKGREENLRFYTDAVQIDQLRHPVSAGGRMTRKRTAHDLRKVAKDRLGDYWSEYLDQFMFIYLAGARGINQDFYEPLDYTGFASNPLQAPDSQHQIYGGAATSKASLIASDVMSRDLVEKANTTAGMIRALDPDASNMVPVSMDGESRYILLMSLYQEYTIRTTTTGSGWLEIQKAAAGKEGNNSKLFQGSLGMINNVILHSHKSVVRFSDYGAGSNLPASRALFMGRQAGVVAYGTPGGARFMWEEEIDDYGNEPVVVAGLIFGFKKTRFNNRDFGVMSIDTSSPTP
jgi:N4-gp56 family major capsid protein